MSTQPKILLVSLSGIGNHLMQSSVFRAIKEKYPDSELTVWVAPRNTATLVKANPDIDNVIRAPIKKSIFGHMRQIYKIRRQNFDTGIVLYPGQLWKSALYLSLAGIDKRIGHKYPYLGDSESSFALTDAVSLESGLHDIEQNRLLLDPLNISIAKELQPYYLPIPKINIAKANFVLKAMRPHSPDAIFVGMHAGSAPDYSWKRWPIKKFGLVGKKLVKKSNAHILLFGNGSELKDMKALRQKIGKQSCSIVINKLLTTAAVIGQCKLFVSNDSGLMHVASALNVPTIGLFGPTDESKTGPRGENSVVVRALGTKPVYDVNTNFDLGVEAHESMLAIKTDQVMEAVGFLLNSRKD